MAFRTRGETVARGEPCWCGAEVVVASGIDSDGEPWSYETCTANVSHIFVEGA